MRLSGTQGTKKGHLYMDKTEHKPNSTACWACCKSYHIPLVGDYPVGRDTERKGVTQWLRETRMKISFELEFNIVHHEGNQILVRRYALSLVLSVLYSFTSKNILQCLCSTNSNVILTSYTAQKKCQRQLDSCSIATLVSNAAKGLDLTGH